MVETTEDDLARELEEMKNSDQKTEVGNISAAAQSSTNLPTAPLMPRKRAPPRRKTGSSNLTAFNEGSAAGEGDIGAD